MKQQINIEDIKGIGEFNGWKGNICLYLTKKAVKSLRGFGISEDMTIQEVYIALIAANKKEL